VGVTSDASRYRVQARILRDGEPAVVLLDLTQTDDPAEAYEPVVVSGDGYEGVLAETVAGLEPGNVVRATLDWTGPDAVAAFETVTVERHTRYRFGDDVTGLFEAARETWETARDAGDAVGSRVTHDTDGQPNGALYVFADPAGRDVFDEFRSGRRPLDPLVERVDEDDPAADGEAPPGGGDGEEGDPTLGGLAARLEQVDETESEDGETGTGDGETDETNTETDETNTETGTTAGDTPPAREVFVLRPVDGAFVVVYVAFRRDGLLAETVRDTYEELA
jgi:hypothetical protein